MQLFTKMTTAIEDFRLGIRAGGTAQTDKPGAVYYASIPHRLIRQVLDRLQLSIDDEFVDIGCGKGRVLAVAAAYPVGSIVGIEYEPALVAIAKHNVSRLAHAKVSVCQAAAENFDYGKATVAYAFNPVEPDVLDFILSKIGRDKINARQSFRMAYVMESRDQRAIFASHSWLQRYDGFTNAAGHVVSFYRSKNQIR